MEIRVFLKPRFLGYLFFQSLGLTPPPCVVWSSAEKMQFRILLQWWRAERESSSPSPTNLSLASSWAYTTFFDMKQFVLSPTVGCVLLWPISCQSSFVAFLVRCVRSFSVSVRLLDVLHCRDILSPRGSRICYRSFVHSRSLL